MITDKENIFGFLGQSFQKSLIKLVLEDKKFGDNIVDVMDYHYFDSASFKHIFSLIQEFHNDFKTIPAYDTLVQLIKTNAVSEQSTSITMHIETLDKIKEHKIEDAEHIKKQSLNFCKQQNLKNAIKEAEIIMKNGKFEQYQEIENIIQKAMQVGITNDEIVDALDEPELVLDEKAREPIPTGVEGIDKLLKGGLAKKELGVVLAPTGVGKTTLLTKFANSAFNANSNVLQIFFEDNINSILRKHYTIWSGFAGDDLTFYKKRVIESVNDQRSKSKGTLKLMKLPSYGTTLSDIKMKIRKYINEGNKVDLVIIDYVDCITNDKNSSEDEWKGEGSIMRGIETMASEFDVAIWVATQGDRSSISSEVVMTNQMGGSIKKAQIGHVIVSVGKTLEQKDQKLATITMLKSRVGSDGVVFSNCKFDNELIIIDTETQNTLLGHKEEVIQKKNQRIQEVYQNSSQFRNNSITSSAEMLLAGKA